MKHETETRTVSPQREAATTCAPCESLSALQFKQQLAGMSYEEQVRAIQPDMPLLVNVQARSDKSTQLAKADSSADNVQMQSDEALEEGVRYSLPSEEWCPDPAVEEQSAGGFSRRPDGYRLWGFDQGESELKPVHWQVIDVLRVLLQKQAEDELGDILQWWRYIDWVVGFASPEGEESQNLQLGHERASAIVEALFGPRELEQMAAEGLSVSDLLHSEGETEGADAERGCWEEYRAAVIELLAEIPRPEPIERDENPNPPEPTGFHEPLLDPDLVEDLNTIRSTMSWALAAVQTNPIGFFFGSLSFLESAIGDWLDAVGVVGTMRYPYGFAYSVISQFAERNPDSLVYPSGLDRGDDLGGWFDGIEGGKEFFQYYQLRLCDDLDLGYSHDPIRYFCQNHQPGVIDPRRLNQLRSQPSIQEVEEYYRLVDYIKGVEGQAREQVIGQAQTMLNAFFHISVEKTLTGRNERLRPIVAAHALIWPGPTWDPLE